MEVECFWGHVHNMKTALFKYKSQEIQKWHSGRNWGDQEKNTEENKLSREKVAAGISQSVLDKGKFQILLSSRSVQAIEMVLLKPLVKSHAAGDTRGC